MKKLLLLSLLILLSGCSEKNSKFKIGECVKGEYVTLQIKDVRNFSYILSIIKPENFVKYGDTIYLKKTVADRAFKKISCP